VFEDAAEEVASTVREFLDRTTTARSVLRRGEMEK